VHTWEVSPFEVSTGLKLIFSAHMNTMELNILEGIRQILTFGPFLKTTAPEPDRIAIGPAASGCVEVSGAAQGPAGQQR
jgi:hypothetical protein